MAEKTPQLLVNPANVRDVPAAKAAAAADGYDLIITSEVPAGQAYFIAADCDCAGCHQFRGVR